MVNNIEINKVYWFIEKWRNAPEKCMIIGHNPAIVNLHNYIEHWDGRCLETKGVRGFIKEDLYETEKEAREMCNQIYEKNFNILKEATNNPENFIADLINTKVSDIMENGILDTEEVKKYLKEKAKEYFNIDVN